MYLSAFIAGMAITNLVLLKVSPSWRQQFEEWADDDKSMIQIMLFINILFCIPYVNIIVTVAFIFGGVIWLFGLLTKWVYDNIFK